MNIKPLTYEKIDLYTFLFTSLFTSAQDTATVEQYCRMVISETVISTKVNIELDPGEETKLFAGDTRFRDELTGKLKNFNSVVEAMNYMGAQGWSLVNAFRIGDSRICHYYYFRKRFKRAEFVQKMQVGLRPTCRLS